MLPLLSLVCLVLSVLNWVVFLLITLRKDMPDLDKMLKALLHPPPATGGMGVVVQQSAIDPVKLAAATGSLAGAFKKAGAAPTTAALAVFFMLLAVIAAGADKL